MTDLQRFDFESVPKHDPIDRIADALDRIAASQHAIVANAGQDRRDFLTMLKRVERALQAPVPSRKTKRRKE